MTEYDPRLVAPTCLYLASKAEESTVQARLLVFYIKKLSNSFLLNLLLHELLCVWSSKFTNIAIFCLAFVIEKLLLLFIYFADNDEKYRFERYEIKEILEMEMKILEALNYHLVVYHPYRALSQ